MPCSLAAFATMGAAPVPVPPPIPAVMKTRSAPRIASLISSMLSSAAALPTAGSGTCAETLGCLFTYLNLDVCLGGE